MNPIPLWAQSSVDPTQISTTIESVGKVLAGVVTFFAVLQGVDPVIAGQQWGGFVTLVATGAPAGYAAWYAGEAIFGAARKLFILFFKKQAASAGPNPTLTQSP